MKILPFKPSQWYLYEAYRKPTYVQEHFINMLAYWSNFSNISVECLMSMTKIFVEWSSLFFLMNRPFDECVDYLFNNQTP